MARPFPFPSVAPSPPSAGRNQPYRLQPAIKGGKACVAALRARNDERRISIPSALHVFSADSRNGARPAATDTQQGPEGMTPLLGPSFFDRRRRGEVVEHRRNSTISSDGGDPAGGEPGPRNKNRTRTNCPRIAHYFPAMAGRSAHVHARRRPKGSC